MLLNLILKIYITLQVSVCDDYSLPVDFVKRIDFGSLKNLHHVPISLTATSPLAPEQVYYLLLSVFLSFYNNKYYLKACNGNTESNCRSLKLLPGYSNPKDQQEFAEFAEVNEHLCSSGTFHQRKN